MARNVPAPRRALRAVLIGTLVALLAGSGWGFAVAADKEPQASSIELGRMHEGDEIRYEESWRIWSGEAWVDEEYEPETYAFVWEGPQDVILADGTVQQVNVLREDDEFVGQETDRFFYVDPETGDGVAGQRFSGAWSNGAAGTVGAGSVWVPYGERERMETTRSTWFEPTALPCGIVPSLPETLVLSDSKVSLPDCHWSNQGLGVTGTVELAQYEGVDAIVVSGGRSGTLAELLAEQLSDLPEDVHDRTAVYEIKYWFAPGVPYAFAYERYLSLDATYEELGWASDEDEEEEPLVAPDAQYQVRIHGSLEHFKKGGDGELLSATSKDRIDIPDVDYGPVSTLGVQPPDWDGFFHIQDALDFAMDNTNGDLAAYMEAHPDAYVARAYHENLDDGGARVQQWSLLLHDHSEGFRLIVQEREEPVGYAATRHGPGLDAPLTTTEHEVVDWGEPYWQDTYWAPPPRDMLPAQMPTPESVYQLWQAWGDALVSGQPGYWFEIDCLMECESPTWSVAAGDNIVVTERTFGMIEDGTLTDSGAGQVAGIDEQGTRFLADHVYFASESLTPRSEPDSAQVDRDTTAGMQVDDPWWAAPTPVAIAGAGLLGLIAGLLYAYAPNLKLLGFGLFSRVRNDQVLDHPVRRNLHLLIEANPGIHMQEAARRLDKSSSVVRHHVGKLQAAGLVSAKQGPRHMCYFIQGSTDDPVMAAASRIKGETARKVMLELIQDPDLKAVDVARRLGIAKPTVSFHLRRLEEAGLLELDRRGRSLVATPTDLGRKAVMV